MKMPKVSACIITYNQEDFIEECLESVLSQSFEDMEIVIGDDCSTDKTSEICEYYQKKYPTLIKYRRRTENLGMMGNWIATIKDCQGKYIALCEGDDYWTDPLKLQKQVDFLEANSTFVLHSHNVQIVGTEFGQKVNKPYHELQLSAKISTEQLISGFRLPTNSIIFRGNLKTYLFKDLWMHKLRSADKCLYLTLAHYGNIFYDNAIMAAYRKHPGGAVGSYGRWDYNKHMVLHRNQIFFWINFKRFFYPKYRKIIKANIAKEYGQMALRAYKEEGYVADFLYCAVKTWMFHRPSFKQLRSDISPLLRSRLRVSYNQQHLNLRIFGSKLKQRLLTRLRLK